MPTVTSIAKRHEKVTKDLAKHPDAGDQYQIDSEMFLQDLEHLSKILEIRGIKSMDIIGQRVRGLPKDRTICIAIKMETYKDKIGSLLASWKESV